MIISLIAGYITALLPIWSWDSRAELFIAAIAICIVYMIVLTSLQEKIKRALTSDNVKGPKRIFYQ